jgi:tRNA (mo5U34)-methyltransferase
MSIEDIDSREQLRREIGNHRWIHTIDVGNGLETPGVWPRENQAPMMKVFDQLDFRGKKVLDIGCLDGLWSFEAERRGAAEVYATDLISQATPGRGVCFRMAHKLRGSRAKYFPDLSVFNVRQLNVTDFDIVLFLGLYYHLKNPLLAFARVRQVLKEGGIMVVEGQVIDSPDVSAHFYYRRHFADDPTNWWIPTIPCLCDWIECSFFEIEKEYRQTYAEWRGVKNTGRYIVRASAVCRQDPNLIVPDEDLGDFDLNDYYPGSS